MSLLAVVQQLGLWGQHHAWWLVYGAVGLCGLMLLVSLCRVHAQAATTHGSAQWATTAAIKQAGL